MFRNLKLLLMVGLSLWLPPSHSKELYKEQEFLSTSVEEIAKDMINLNANLDSLTNTISNLVPRRSIKSSF